MYIVKYTNAFKKSYKRAKKRGLDMSILESVIDTLRQGKELDAKYKPHALKGNFIGYHECHLQPDWLLIYLIEDDILTLTLADTGTHSDLFKK
ncbi:type II toxin-antitoxin system YafQ family toxin [Ligilactobacillus ceti]|uniref:type II toxin-antitoxin system YafQ family toxin n=1 Tax=Ligilactobacillus ceti TaxID=395085 RepID=UPI00047F4A70|nr:type II toxin-antitoxin system YafQ family toxin [Ligilactobacillus ceti]